ncbi:MAG: arginine--tRNA ligase [Candidatus Nanoarchaeia archaeon]|nr:arginine--tRNA ligase [Candidatus Nanoarchaeia archaeon]
MFEQEIIKILKKQIKNLPIELETPKNPEFGDYSFPCFTVAKTLKKNPAEAAKQIANKLEKSDLIEKITPVGPYINFFIKKEKIMENTLTKVLKEKENYGNLNQKQTIVIESPGPNTNKPLHLGHLRNMALGLSLANILRKAGNKVINVDIINDRGIHICQSMLAYKKYGKNKEPKGKSDHFVGDFYVLYNQKLKQDSSLETEAQDLLLKWEQKDPETIKLWNRMNKWALEGMKQTYLRFGMKIDKAYKESEHYQEGKSLVLEGLSKGIFKKNKEGSVIIDLSDDNLGEKVLLRSDGTSIYITQDLYLAKKRYNDFKMDKMIYVVASEQEYHFKVLFKLIKLLGFKFADNLYHLAYGMVHLPEGKMKSREGKIVDADNILDEIHELAKKELLKRNSKMDKKELETKAEAIGLGSVKFFILKYDPLKDFVYDPNKSISFEGETGPYIQYTYARLKSILRKEKPKGKIDYELLNEELEKEIVKDLASYPDLIEKAAKEYKPSLITSYLTDLSQKLNSYYVKYPVLKENQDVKTARMNLILASSYVLKSGLNLLGIESLEVM